MIHPYEPEYCDSEVGRDLIPDLPIDWSRPLVSVALIAVVALLWWAAR